MPTTSDHHDWHSEAYVERWLSEDVTRDESRRPVLRELLRGPVAAVGVVDRVLDVGGGYGLVTREVLQVFPEATVVLHDFSRPMLDRSRAYLGPRADRVEIHVADLRDPHWSNGVHGPFDLVVSALAIHNVRDPAVRAAVYAEVRCLLRPGGAFLDVDFVDTGQAGRSTMWSLETRLRAVDDARFAEVREVWADGPLVALLART